MDQGPELPKILNKNLFSPQEIYESWALILRKENLKVKPPAISDIALHWLRGIEKYLANALFIPPQAESATVDFNTYSLDQVLLEIRVLRSLVIQKLSASKLSIATDKIFELFDELIAGFSAMSAHQKLSYKEWISLEEVSASSALQTSNSAFRKAFAQKTITDAFLPEGMLGHLNPELVLKERANFLARASKAFAASSGYRETVAKAVALATDEFADWAVIDCLNEDGEYRRVAACHRKPEFQGLTDELRCDYGPKEDAKGVPSEVMRSRRTLFIPEVTDAHYKATARSLRHEEVLRGLGSKSYCCVPLTARGNFIGAITLVSSSRIYTPEDIIFAEEFCSRVALAIDNSLQFLRAQNAIAMRDNFMGMVAHDLKTPLQVILMSTNLLFRIKPNDDVVRTHRMATTIQESAKRMGRLISDLLELSRFEAGHFTIQPKPTKLHSIFGELQRSFTPLALSARVKLEFPPVSELTLNCDRDRLVQALSNLVSNAIKFTPPEGRVSLNYEVLDEAVILSVSDSGCGLTESAIEHIFERFWQANENDSKRGTGIGLSIVKMMVEAHGGTVYAKSVLRSGSQFYIRLPQNIPFTKPDGENHVEQ